MAVTPKPSVAAASPYRSAKSLAVTAQEYGFREQDIIKLAANESRFGPSPKVFEALAAHRGEFSNYPDTNVTELRELLMEKHHVGAEKLSFGHGSGELLALVADAYIAPGDEAIYAEPSFAWYQNATRKNEGVPVAVPVTAGKAVDAAGLLTAITERTKLIWLCNPNNPTGTVLSPSELTDFLAKVPSRVLVVLDEAYIDFIEGGYIDTVDFIRQYDNVILLRTFSKAPGLASFRIGYGIAQEAIIGELLKVKLPSNVSMQAQLAAAASLRDQPYIDEVVRRTAAAREYYYRELSRLGFRYVRSNTNFILVYTGLDSSFLEQEFLRRAVMIRSGEEYGLPGWMRISIGREEENARVIAIFDEIKAQLEKETNQEAVL